MDSTHKKKKKDWLIQYFSKKWFACFIVKTRDKRLRSIKLKNNGEGNDKNMQKNESVIYLEPVDVTAKQNMQIHECNKIIMFLKSSKSNQIIRMIHVFFFFYPQLGSHTVFFHPVYSALTSSSAGVRFYLC